MLKIDIDEFVTTGVFGALGRAPTRETVHTMLGPPDAEGYPVRDQYGNVAFEFDTELNCIYRIMIAYPHVINEKHFGSLDRINAAWTDSRFSVALGRFQPGLRLRDIVNRLPDFEHADMIGESPHRILVYTNRKTGVDLCFAPPTALADHSLYCIVSHPEYSVPENAG